MYAAFATAVPLTVTVRRGDLGSVVIDSLGKTCIATCNYEVPSGMSVSLAGKPGPNGLAWGGACARERSNTCNLIIRTTTSVIASFYEPPG